MSEDGGKGPAQVPTANLATIQNQKEYSNYRDINVKKQQLLILEKLNLEMYNNKFINNSL